MKTLVAFFLVFWCSFDPQRGFGADNVEQFARKYLHARTEKQRLDLCIQMINKGVLYSGSDVADLRRIFQTDFKEMGFNDSTNLGAIVYFVPQKPANIPGGAVDWGGWYLSITYR